MLHRLVAVAEDREPPVECLRALREVSPRAEMVYAGNGMWWLGVVREDTPAMVEGRTLWASNRDRMARGLAVRKASLMKADLMCQGFRLLAAMGSRDGGCDPSPSQCVAAIAPALKATRREEDRALDAQERESDGTARAERSDALLRGDFMQLHARDVYRTSKRTSIVTNGLRTS